jgi:hypothetical protein
MDCSFFGNGLGRTGGDAAVAKILQNPIVRKRELVWIIYTE